MEENDPRTIRKPTEINADQSDCTPAEPSNTRSPAPPEKEPKGSKLPPVTFNESEDPWRKINDQTVPMNDDNTSPASPTPSDMFLG